MTRRSPHSSTRPAAAGCTTTPVAVGALRPARVWIDRVCLLILLALIPLRPVVAETHTFALARLMRYLGVSFGVLRREKCTGDAARRLGNDHPRRWTALARASFETGGRPGHADDITGILGMKNTIMFAESGGVYPKVLLDVTGSGNVAGVDHVGLGSDFDGIPTYVEGLEDVSTFPALLVELSRRGWSDDDLRKVAGENLLRVLSDVQRVAEGSSED